MSLYIFSFKFVGCSKSRGAEGGHVPRVHLPGQRGGRRHQPGYHTPPHRLHSAIRLRARSKERKFFGQGKEQIPHYMNVVLFSLLVLKWENWVSEHLKPVCTSLARRDYTSLRGHWHVVNSSNQLSINRKKRGSWGTNRYHLGIVCYIEGASRYK